MDVDERALYRYIGVRVRTARLTAGLTQRQVAEQLGMRRTSITNIEAGQQKLPLHLLYRLCFVLRIEVTAVLPSMQEGVVVGTELPAVEAQLATVPPKTAEVIRELLREELEEGR